jgi:hypothetical protein
MKGKHRMLKREKRKLFQKGTKKVFASFFSVKTDHFRSKAARNNDINTRLQKKMYGVFLEQYKRFFF